MLTPVQIHAMSGKSSLPVEQLSSECLNHVLSSVGKSINEVNGKNAVLTGYEANKNAQGVLAVISARLEIPKEDGNMESCKIYSYGYLPKPDKPEK
jgi:hypothetical protein